MKFYNERENISCSADKWHKCRICNVVLPTLEILVTKLLALLILVLLMNDKINIFCSTRMKAEEEEEDAEAEKGRDTNGREDSNALLCKHKCPYFLSLFESNLGKV